MKSTRLIAMVCCLGLGIVTPPASGQAPMSSDSETHIQAQPLSVKLEDAKWSRMFPELGARSPQISILRIDPRTQATQLMIRVPKNFHVPMHWHTANETHTVLKGDFIVECNGKRDVLERGDFNYVPSKMPHEAWTPKKEGALLFITVDRAWDVNWVNGTPKPSDMIGGLKDRED
ncbi:MAG TPA: cupin domain-containing protein [Candidatus Eisenbacteria bacterium]|jgi:mannose-6-phosphate isomerase-like protein (cupin superfamily)